MISIWDTAKMRSAREDKDLTVKAAADALNVTPEYLSMLENSHRQPSQKLIVQMCSVYEKTADYFLVDEKNLALP